MKKAWVLILCVLFGAVCSWAAPVDITPSIGDQTHAEDFVGNEDISVHINYDPADGDPGLTATLSGTPNGLVGVSTLGSGSNQTVRLTSSLNLNGINTITLIAANSASADTNIFQVIVTPVNDPPTISGLLNLTIPDTAGSNVFSGVNIEDVDQDNPDDEELTLSITVPPEGGVGTFNGALSFIGTPAEVTAHIQGLLFTPYANANPVGSTGVLNVVLSAEAIKGGEAAVSNASSVGVISMNDDPSAVLEISPQTVYDTGVVKPFQLRSIDDPDAGESFTVSILAVNDLTGQLGAMSPVPTNISGTALAVKNAISNVRYTPNEDVVSGSTNVEFAVVITDSNGATVTNAASNTLEIRGVDSPSTIRNIELDPIRTNDDQPVNPFPSVTIFDPDQGGTEKVTVTLSVNNPALGTLSDTQITSYTPSNATAWIRSIMFTPAGNVIAVGDTETVTLTITVDDGTPPPVSNSGTEIIIRGVNGAPEILGVPAMQPMTVDPADPRPFLNISVNDEANDLLTLTIELDDAAKGSLSNIVSGVDGFTSFSGNPAEVNALLTNLAFVSSATYFGETAFTIPVADSLENVAQQTLRIVLLENPRNILVTRTEDDKELPGSLRYALALAAHNDVITFAFTNDFPAKIRLHETNGVIVLKKTPHL